MRASARAVASGSASPTAVEPKAPAHCAAVTASRHDTAPHGTALSEPLSVAHPYTIRCSACCGGSGGTAATTHGTCRSQGRPRATTNCTDAFVVVLMVVVHVAIVEIDVPRVVRVAGVGSRRPIPVRRSFPLHLFPARRPDPSTRPCRSRGGHSCASAPPRASAFRPLTEAGEGPRDHGTPGAAGPSGIARRLSPWP